MRVLVGCGNFDRLRHGTVRGVCAVEGCERPKKARDWCNTHYQRWRGKGEPGPAEVRQQHSRPRPCTVEGCLEPSWARGWCSTHYNRWRKKGEPGDVATHRPTGGYIDAGGYRIVKNHTGEHRNVMEAVLGRALAPGETVHHVNGVRSDNRAENLELWSKSHAAGQRVSDQVAWAIKVLTAYAPQRLAIGDDIFLQMKTGGLVDLLAMDEADVDIEDVASALSLICRFGGHTREFYSVAQHSVVVSQLCPDHALEALLHDASEAYTGDCPTPIKRRPELAGFREVEDRLTRVIRRKYGLPKDETAAVKEADTVALLMEKRDLMPAGEPWGPSAAIPRTRIVPWTAAEARSEFLRTFERLSATA